MHKDEFIKKIQQVHEEIIRAIDLENPKIILYSKLKSNENMKNTFLIVKSSTKIKLSSLIEQKINIKSKSGEHNGTIIDVYENFIVIFSRKRMNLNEEYVLTIHANYNNEILLEKAMEHLNSKESNRFIYETYESDQDINFNNENTKNINFFNLKLNKSQRNAVECSLNCKMPLKIIGPPGTGKTQTIVEIILQILNQNKTVLVCGPSNISIDNIITRYMNLKGLLQKECNFYRLGSSQKGLTEFNLEEMAEEAVNFMKKEKNEKDFYKERSKRKASFISEYKKSSPLVFATLFSSLKENHHFDLCIVDEACQALEIECLVGIVKANNFLLFGDPNQLSAMHTSTSLFEKLNLPTLILNEQYRMHSDLLSFSNSRFYKNQIISQKQDDFKFFNQSKILFIDTSFFRCHEETLDGSKMNVDEARIIKDVVSYLKRIESGSIGVIVPYSAQVLYLKEMLDCSVETVDGFQGREMDFIIIGLVRSNMEFNIGFLENDRRMNVALTRCKKGMVLVGDASTFTKNKFFSALFKHLDSSACVVDPESFYLQINNEL